MDVYVIGRAAAGI